MMAHRSKKQTSKTPMAAAANDQEICPLGRLQKRQFRSAFRNCNNDAARKGGAEDLLDRGIQLFPNLRTGVVARPDTVRKDGDFPAHQDLQCGACQVCLARRRKEGTFGSFRTVNPDHDAPPAATAFAVRVVIPVWLFAPGLRCSIRFTLAWAHVHRR